MTECLGSIYLNFYITPIPLLAFDMFQKSDVSSANNVAKDS